MTESSMNPKAWRYEKEYRWTYLPDKVKPIGVTISEEKHDQMTSFGLMQVMGAVLREHGYSGVLRDILNDPDVQLDYGCRHLEKKIKKYGTNLGILSYNSGSPRRNADGTFVNAGYLTKVLKHSKGWQDA